MTDKELALRVVQHSDHQAFAEIVHRHSAKVFSKAIGILHNEEEAAEVTQQTFVRAYEAIDAWRGEQLAPWLAAIAAHTALKHIDKRRRRRTTSLDDMPPATLNTLPSAAEEDDHEAQLQRMEAAIAELPEADQQLLRLHYYEQLRTADIARQTGLSQSNVLVRLHRIRERLKTKLTHERND